MGERFDPSLSLSPYVLFQPNVKVRPIRLKRRRYNRLFPAFNPSRTLVLTVLLLSARYSGVDGDLDLVQEVS